MNFTIDNESTQKTNKHIKQQSGFLPQIWIIGAKQNLMLLDLVQVLFSIFFSLLFCNSLNNFYSQHLLFIHEGKSVYEWAWDAIYFFVSCIQDIRHNFSYSSSESNIELKYGKVVLLAHPFSCVVLSWDCRHWGENWKEIFHFCVYNSFCCC